MKYLQDIIKRCKSSVCIKMLLISPSTGNMVLKRSFTIRSSSMYRIGTNLDVYDAIKLSKLHPYIHDYIFKSICNSEDIKRIKIFITENGPETNQLDQLFERGCILSNFQMIDLAIDLSGDYKLLISIPTLFTICENDDQSVLFRLGMKQMFNHISSNTWSKIYAHCCKTSSKRSLRWIQANIMNIDRFPGMINACKYGHVSALETCYQNCSLTQSSVNKLFDIACRYNQYRIMIWLRKKKPTKCDCERSIREHFIIM